MLGTRRAQAWRYHPAYRRPRHVHAESEFNLVLAGTGLMSVGATQVPLVPGTLLWLPPGVEHGLEGASADFDLVVVGFQPGLLDVVQREHGLFPCFDGGTEQLLVDPKALGEGLLGVADGNEERVVEERLVHSLLSLIGGQRSPGVEARAAELLRN